jgi:cytidine deaminase
MPSLPEFTRRAALASLTIGLAAAQRPIPSDVFSKFGSPAREKLLATLRASAYRGRIDAPTAAELLELEGAGLDALMLKLLPVARLGSHAPLSNYHVGAVIQGSSKSLYLGANIEAPGQVLGLAVHGEQAAIANAYMHGETGVSALAVTAAPCGHCRQFLTEMVPDGNLRILVLNAPATQLATLLPMAFGPRDLGRDRGAMPIGTTPLALREQSRDALATVALEAASKSYSPYTQSPSGVGLITASGRSFSGSYIENVAFNPSLSPLQTALAGALAAGEELSRIVRVVLVEAEDARISQKASTQATLEAVAPSARLEVLPARRIA